MNICLINPADSPRTEVFDLGYHLSEKGHNIIIIYPTNGKIIKSKIKAISFPSHFVPRIHYAIPNMQMEYKLISKLAKDEKCEVIQACDHDFLTSLPPAFFKRKTNVPFVLTTDAFPGVSWFFGNRFVDTIAKLYSPTIGKFIINSCNELVVLSNDLIEDAIRMRIPKGKVQVIPNGVDFEQFNPYIDGYDLKNKLHIKNDEKVLLFVGRLSLVKRIDILISLTKRLLKDGFKIKTILVGDGEYKDYYKKLAGSIENIVFVGPVPHTEIQKYFAIADIFVLTSLSEGLPNVLLEASACGKTIVATNKGGISDIVVHGKTGFLAIPEDVNSFLHYVELLLNDEDLSRRFGRKAYEHVKKEFNWDVIIRKYECLYATLVK